jgi:cytochrome c553
MKLFIRVLGVALLLAPAFMPGIAAAPPQDEKSPPNLPSWAYPINPPDDKGSPDDGSAHHVPGSNKALTRTQATDAYNVPDWHPEEHPSMPTVVEHGRKPGVRGCGYCHLPNGLGRPENASLASLPPSYIMQQIADFKTGARKTSEPNMAPPVAMAMIAGAVTDADLKEAADYFSSLKLKPWIRVVETSTVPKTKISGTMHVVIEGGGKEPIGNRIIEVPEDLKRTELRDAASGFIAYAPVGSVKKGEALVTTGGAGKTIRCTICHGPDLHGLGPVPPIAGRSPSYIVRQLFDIQQGNRHGQWTELMKAPVAHLSNEDFVSIAAYLASRKP